MTHCTCATEAPRPLCSAGSATFTAELSMNTMLLPRMVAARTQRRVPGGDGGADGPARIAAASHGGRTAIVIAAP